MNDDQNMNGKRVLVAGAAGFVGSHFCDYYLEKNCEIVGIDNLVSGSLANLKHLENHPRFEFREHNICDPLKASEKFDFVFNFASPASPIDFEEIPLEILHTSTIGVENLLNYCKESGAKLLQTSTSEVYGDPLEHPQSETYRGNVNTMGPRACYDESKRLAETLCYIYKQKYAVDLRIVRIFNTYGPRMRHNDGRVIPNFINQALAGKPLTVFGEGQQTRSFCYVSDLVRAIDYVFHTSDFTPFNIGNPDEYTILETAKIIIESLKSTSEIAYKPLPKDDPTRRKPDISKLQKVCDYKPLVSFEEGLQKTTKFFKELNVSK